MKRAYFSFLLVFCAVGGLLAQSDPVLLTIDGQPVTKSEYEYTYRKNNTNVYSETDKKSPGDYLDLFIDFKLKVIEAEHLKMDTSQAFINELTGYRKEVAAPYLTDHNYDDQLVHEMYRRMTLEVNASHILLRLDPNASPEQEKEVLNKIRNIRQEIIDGKDFEETAVEYSQDPSAVDNRGNLGYFSAFMMVFPFETAAYETPVGQVSQPVRTKFGYHLVKVNEIQKNQGEIQVAHIMKAIPKGADEEKKKEIKTGIDAIYRQLLAGADFAELAKKQSDDRQSAVEGGKMPWFSAGHIIPSFSNPAFALKNIGDITEPIETRFGYHIIKKLGEKPVASFEQLKDEIEGRIRKDPERSNSSQQVFIAELKKQYNYSENKDGEKQLEGLTIQELSSLPDVNLFTIEGKNYTGSDFRNWVSKKNIKSGSYLSYFEPWVDDEIISLEDSKLEDKYPEFKYLIREYHDGILLFNISQEKIWNFASEDTLGLEAFYAKMKNKHMWTERFKGSIITCKNDSVREEAENLFSAGLNAEEVTEHLNDGQEVIGIKNGAWEQGADPVVDYYVWNGDEPENFDSAITFIRGDKIGPEAKTLNEARGLYVADYQKALEEKWIKELRHKYKIKVDKKVLDTIEGV